MARGQKQNGRQSNVPDAQYQDPEDTLAHLVLNMTERLGLWLAGELESLAWVAPPVVSQLLDKKSSWFQNDLKF